MQKVPITERAAIQRINRKLKPNGLIFKKSRSLAMASLGDYYVIDATRNAVKWSCLSLTSFGHKVGAIEEWEEVK